jgi:hypothetical protein
MQCVSYMYINLHIFTSEIKLNEVVSVVHFYYIQVQLNLQFCDSDLFLVYTSHIYPSEGRTHS